MEHGLWHGAHASTGEDGKVGSGAKDDGCGVDKLHCNCEWRVGEGSKVRVLAHVAVIITTVNESVYSFAR